MAIILIKIFKNILYILLTLSFFYSLSLFASTNNKKNQPTLNPAWNVGINNKRTTPKNKSKLFYYLSKIHVGAGIQASIPEIYPIDFYLFSGRIFGLRFFYAPLYRFNIRVLLPEDTLSSTNGILIKNPALDIKLNAKWGPHYGMEALVFPFSGIFFISLGYSIRELNIAGRASSPLLIMPEGGDESTVITTRTIFNIGADVSLKSSLIRFSVGWFWHYSRHAYLISTLGATFPKTINKSAKVDTNIDVPGDNDHIMEEKDIQELKKEREAKLEEQTLKAIKPGESQVIPILTVGFGVYF